MPTDRYSVWNTDTHTVHSSGSFTPAGNSLLVAAIRSRHTTTGLAEPTFAGFGGTWQKWVHFEDDTTGATRSVVTVYALVVGASPSADTVDVTLPAETALGSHLHVVEFTDEEIDGTGDALDVLVGAATTGTALSIDLGAFADPDNIGLAFFGTQANEVLTASDGTLVGESSGSQPTTAFAGVYGVNNPTLAASGSGGSPCCVGFELAAPSAVIESLAASVLGSGSVTADLIERVQLAAAPLGSGSVTADLIERVQLAASTLGVSSVVADLGGTDAGFEALAASVLGVGGTTAGLSVQDRLEASVVGAATVTAGLGVRSSLAAAVFGVGVVAGDLTGTGEVVSTRQDVQQVAYYMANGGIAF